jgi:hypothetical protein
MTREEYDHACAMKQSLEWDIEYAKREIEEYNQTIQQYESEHPEEF